MLFKIFSIFFKLGFIAFGGGYSMIPLVELEIVEKHKIVSKERFVNIVSIAEGLPGAIALNISIFVGFMKKGVIGAIVAALGSVLPSLIILSIIMITFSNISTLPIVQSFMAGIRPVVVGLILYAAYKIGIHAYKYKWYFVLTIIGLSLAMIGDIVPLPVVVISGLVLGVVLNLMEASFVKSDKDTIYYEKQVKENKF